MVIVRPRAVVMVNSPSLGESPGPGWWSWGVGVMCQPVRWMMPWCRRHNRTRLVVAVVPPWAHSMTWWASHQPGGASHPGNTHPPSRTSRARRISRDG